MIINRMLITIGPRSFLHINQPTERANFQYFYWENLKYMFANCNESGVVSVFLKFVYIGIELNLQE